MLNGTVSLGIVVYVDEGILNGVELVTLLSHPLRKTVEQHTAPRKGPFPGIG